MSQNCIDIILAEHRKVDGLFAQLETEQNDDVKKKIMTLITEDLSAHSSCEEQLVYPTGRKLLGDSKTDHSLEEHQEVKELLAAIEKLKPSDAEWNTKVKTLITSVRHHVQEEENDYLPRLRAKMSEEDLKTMGSVWETLKKVAPSRPHPSAPSTQPGASMVAPLAAFMDKVSKMVVGGEKDTHGTKRDSDGKAKDDDEGEAEEEDEENDAKEPKKGAKTKTKGAASKAEPEKKRTRSEGTTA